LDPDVPEHYLSTGCASRVIKCISPPLCSLPEQRNGDALLFCPRFTRSARPWPGPDGFAAGGLVNVVAPSIHASLRASGAGLQLVVAGYTIAYAVLLVTGARLGDVLGHRRLFRCSSR
jgi:hypothetical protein